MATQYIEDPVTKQQIPFEWDKPDPPTSQDIEGLFQAVKGGGTTNTTPQEAPGLFDKLAQRGQDAVSAYSNLGKEAWQGAGNIPLYRPTLRTAGAITGAAGDVLGSAIEGGVKMALPESVRENWKLGMQDILNAPIGKFAMALYQKGGKAWDKFEKVQPEIAKDVKDLANVTGFVPLNKVGSMATKEGVNIVKDVYNLSQRGTANVDALINFQVRKSIEKAVRPPVSVQQTAGQTAKYFDNATSAVKSIVENKDNLFFINDAGETVTGQLPSSLKQLSEAIDQTKKEIFKSYDSMAQEAGAQTITETVRKEAPVIRQAVPEHNPVTNGYSIKLGEDKYLESKGAPIEYRTIEEAQQAAETLNKTAAAKAESATAETAATKPANMIELKPIIDELKEIRKNPVIKDNYPELANYAYQKERAYESRRAYSMEQAQDVVTMFNEKLHGFYSKPTYEEATKAYIDALVANNLRKQLDETITKAVGEGYQELKHRYGALKAIEKDVGKRSGVDARKNIKGLIDFSDIFSGSEVVRGLISMNPSTITAGVAAKFVAALYKKMNDPNRIIKNMFNEVASIMEKDKPFVPQSKTGQTINNMLMRQE